MHCYTKITEGDSKVALVFLQRLLVTHAKLEIQQILRERHSLVLRTA